MRFLRAGNDVTQRITARAPLRPAETARAAGTTTPFDAVVPAAYPWWSYAGCALFALAFHLLLSRRLYGLHVFGQYDVLFNADPNEGLVNLGHGWGKSEFKHLTLTYFFSPFARMFAKSMSALSLSATPETVLREQFALVLLALFSALRGVLMLEVARYIGLRLPAALLLGALAFFSFSNLMFGGIPESFPLSATCIVVGYYLALRPIPLHRIADPHDRAGLRAEALGWGLLFVVSSGITVTNVIPLGVLLMVRQLRLSGRTLRSSVLLVGLTSLTAIGTNLLIAAAAKQIQQTRTVEIAYSPVKDQYVHRPTPGAVPSIGRAFGNGVLAGEPTVAPLTIPKGKVVWYTTMVSYELGRSIPASDWIGLVLVVVGIGAGIRGYRGLQRHAAILWGSVAILLSNIAIHLFFGDEYVLYSLHWHYSLMVIVAGALLWLQLHHRRSGWVVCAVLVAAVAVSNLVRVSSIVQSLADHRLPAPYGVAP